MRSLLLLVSMTAALTAGPAWACLEIVTPQGEARAFREADQVLRMQALTEEYQAVPGRATLKVGVATARVVETLKGRAARGQVVTYRVADGGGEGGTNCPARRATRPGGTYKLYLKEVSDWGPPVILLPTD